MLYSFKNEEIHFDFTDNLNHFQAIKCELYFKPHQRRRIIKQANQQSKEAFQRFKKQIDPYLERYSTVQDKIKIIGEELKLFNNHEDAIKYRDSYDEVYTDRDKLYNLFRSIAQDCYWTFLYTSPPTEFFSSSFHIVKEILVLASVRKDVFKLKWSDVLPIKSTLWNTQEKLFTFLLARKRYFFDCYCYVKEYHERVSWTDYPGFSEEQKRLIILFLLRENYVNDSDENLCYYFLNGYKAYRKITWLKSTIELTFLVYQLKIKLFTFQSPYRKYSATDTVMYYFMNQEEGDFNKSTLNQYIRRFEEPEDNYPENDKLIRIKKMLKTLKTENSRKLLSFR